jgi:outer membrane protein assembly factor BamD (BamD/ComL family)
VLLSGAKKAPDYQQVIAKYSNTPAGASAYLLLAQAQRTEKNFTGSNTTLQEFIAKHPKHELITTARMAMAANFESMGKSDEALLMYQQIVASYSQSYSAPLALISQVHLLKAKNQTDAARQVCEKILTEYRESFWAGEAMRELRTLKPTQPAPPPVGSTNAPAGAAVPPPTLARPAAQAAPSSAPTVNSAKQM